MSITVTWAGQSGQQYNLETFPVGTEFNRVSGVYIGCRQLITGNFEALYVGEAQSLYDRLNAGAKNHDGLIRAARHGMTHIGAFVVSGDAERLRIETDLRHGLDPVCNRQSVPANALSLLDIVRMGK